MTHRVDVLYIEDDVPSATLLREAFVESGVPVAFHAVHDAPEALAFLAGEPPFKDVPRPDLVLLDLDLGDASGFDVLETVRTSLDPDALPVVVFTTSDDARDVVTAYESGANAFVQKPVDFGELVTFAHRAVDFWGQSADAGTVC